MAGNKKRSNQGKWEEFYNDMKNKRTKTSNSNTKKKSKETGESVLTENLF